MSVTLSLIVIFWLLLYIWSVLAFRYWKKRGIYSPPTVFPVGHSWKFLTCQSNWGEFMAKHYESTRKENPLVGIYLLFAPCVIVNDLDIIKKVLIKDYRHFQGHGIQANEYSDPIGRSFFHSSGEEWREVRLKLSPAFSTSKLKDKIDDLVTKQNNMVKFIENHLKTSELIDAKDLMARIGIEMVATSLFGIDVNAFKLAGAEFREKSSLGLNKGLVVCYEEMLTFTFPKLAKLLFLSTNHLEVNTYFLKFFPELMRYRENNNLERIDVLQKLIELKNDKIKQGEKFSMSRMSAHAFIMLVAGFDGTSIVLSYLLRELAINPEVQDLVKEEVDTILPEEDQITYGTLNNCTYIHKVIQEALRKYPSLPFHFRQCTRDYTIPDTNYRIDKDTTVIIPALGIHMNPDIYPDPHKFDPERFSPENIAKRHPLAFMPFGEGPRVCIGQRLAFIMMKMTLLTLFRHYEIFPSEKTPLPIHFKSPGFALRCVEDITIRFKRRDL